MTTTLQHVEVVSEKTPESYARVLRRLSIEPQQFVMVGNSMRSDILPVVALGGRGIYVPNDQTWHYENADLPPDVAHGVVEVRGIGEVPQIIRGMSANSGEPR